MISKIFSVKFQPICRGFGLLEFSVSVSDINTGDANTPDINFRFHTNGYITGWFFPLITGRFFRYTAYHLQHHWNIIIVDSAIFLGMCDDMSLEVAALQRLTTVETWTNKRGVRCNISHMSFFRYDAVFPILEVSHESMFIPIALIFIPGLSFFVYVKFPWTLHFKHFPDMHLYAAFLIGAMWLRRFWSTAVQVMACYLKAPSPF